MHLSVRLIQKVAPRFTVLALGEGLHILHHLGEKSGVRGEQLLHAIGKIFQGGWGLSRRGCVYIPWAEVLSGDVEFPTSTPIGLVAD